MYDSMWEKYRLRFLTINWECYACGKHAEALDHLEPHKSDIDLFWKENNFIPLCNRCHNTVTTLFDRKYIVGNPITKKIAWLNKKRIPGMEWNFKKVKVVPFNGEILEHIAQLKLKKSSV